MCCTILTHVRSAALASLLLAASLTGCGGGPLAEPPAVDAAMIAAAPAPTSAPLTRDGIVLPAGAVDRLGDRRWRRADQLYVVTWLSDGTLITAGNDHQVQAWNADGGLRWNCDAVDEQLVVVEPALDGAVLVVASSDRTVVVLDTQTRQVLHRLPGHDIGSKQGAISPEGDLLAIEGADDTTLIWDLRSGKRLAALPEPFAHGNGKVFLPTKDGQRRLAFGTDPVRLADALSGKILAEGPVEDAFIGDIGYDPIGARLIVVGDRFIDELDPDTLRSRRRLTTPFHANRLAIHPRGTQVALGDYAGGLWRWDLAGEPVAIELLTDHDDVQDLCFSPDGSRLAVVRDDEERVRFFDCATWQEIDATTGVSGQVMRLAISPDGTTVATDDGSRLAVWDLATRRVVRRLGTGRHGVGVAGLVYSPDGRRLVSAGWDDTLYLWNLADGTHEHRLLGFEAHNLAYGDGVLIAGGGRHVVALDAATLDKRWSQSSPKHQDEGVLNALWSPLGVVLHEQHRLRLLDPVTSAERRRFELGSAAPGYGCFAGATASGLLAYTRGTGLELLDVAKGRLVARVEGAAVPTLSRDGRLIAYCDEDALIVLDADTARPLARAPAPLGSAQAVFTPDGTRIVTAASDGELLVWEVKTLLGK